MSGLRVQLGSHYTDGGANIGMQHSIKNSASGWAHEGAKCFVNNTNSAGHEVGSAIAYDSINKKMHMDLAVRLNLTDHTLGMKVCNTGVAQFLFGWKQNSAMNAQVGT